MSIRLGNKQMARHRLRDRVNRIESDSVAAGTDLDAWDRAVVELNGHLMQSWRWGEFKRHEGWRVERIQVSGAQGTGLAQVLFWPRGPVSTAFIPRGPVIAGDHEAVTAELVPLIDAACRRHRTLTLAVEASEALPLTERPEHFGFTICASRYSPGRTVVVPLLDDPPLLSQMNSGKRNDIRHAQRKGVEVRRIPPDEASILAFHAVLRETAARQGFRINPPDHYSTVLQLFDEDAALLVASVAGVDVAGLIVVCFGEEAIYLFGASMTEQPVRGATALLQFEAMRWARSRGCRRYDLWGIDRSLVPVADDSLDRSTMHACAEDDGLCRFKVGFGGTVVVFPRRIERHFHPQVVAVLRRANDLRQAVRG